MKIRYNAPTVLTFAFLSALVLILTQTLFPSLTMEWFAVRGRQDYSPLMFRNYVNLFTHVLGHSSWTHLVGNFAFILVIGPILEEIYGSISLLIMIGITALVTGILNILFFSTGLMGASGIVFMMILLASFTNVNRGEIPLTFIMVLVLYLGRELIASFNPDLGQDVSQFAHIVGGFIGSLFGFFRGGK